MLAREGGRCGLADLRHMVGFGARALIDQAMEMTGDRRAGRRAWPAWWRFPRPLPRPYRRRQPAVSGRGRDAGGLSGTRRAAGRADQQAAGTDRPAAARRWDWTRYFAAVYGAGRKPYTKPDPRIFHDVVAELGGGRRR